MGAHNRNKTAAKQSEHHQKIENKNINIRQYVNRTNLSMIYLIIIMCIYPFISEGNYFNITGVKWLFLQRATIAYILLYIALIAVDVRKDKYQFHLSGTKKLIIAFAACIIVSALISPYKDVVWSGGQARYTGVYFMLLMLEAVICIEDSFRCEELNKLLMLFGISGLVMALWTALNFVGIDPFNMHENIAPSQYRSYMAGIGNIVFLGSYFCMYFMLSCVFFITDKSGKKYSKVLWAVSLFAAGTGVFLSGTDSSVIACVIGFVVIVPYVIWKSGRLKETIDSIIVIMLAGVFSQVLEKYSDYGEAAFDTIMKKLVSYNVFIIVLAIIIAVWIGIRLVGTFNVSSGKWIKDSQKGLKKDLQKDPQKGSQQTGKVIMAGFYAVTGIAGVIVLIWYMKNNMNADWGTGRGYAWMSAFGIFMKEPVLNKIFGNGPDTFANLLIDYYGSNIGSNGQYFDNVHCEYLQYLISYGIAGVIAYICCIFKSVLILADKCNNTWAEYKRALLGVIGAVTGYMIQAGAGLNQVMTTPILFMLVAVGYSCRNTK